MNRQTIYPVKGRLIHNPKTGRLIKKETVVDIDNPFWIRCLKAGDVSLKAPEEQKEEK